MNRKIFKASDLKIIADADPADIPYIVEGATVWLRSGSPPMTVVERHGDRAVTSWDEGGMKSSGSFPVACLTPEPSPVRA